MCVYLTLVSGEMAYVQVHFDMYVSGGRVHPLKIIMGFSITFFFCMSMKEKKEADGEAKQSNCLHKHFSKNKM